ncbi:Serine/threonine-protein kinase 17A, partial [Schistosoma japonicum]
LQKSLTMILSRLRQICGQLEFSHITYLLEFLHFWVMINILQCQNITNGTIIYPDTLFKHRSSNSIDFIQRLLQRSPTQRMSAKECLSHPWLQPTNQPIIVGPKITYQSQSTLKNNTNHIHDKLNYATELFHIGPLIELVDECLSSVPLTYFTTQSPIYIFPYVNTVYQTNIVKTISLASYSNYLSIVKPVSTDSIQSSIAITNSHSLTEQSFGKTFKTLFTGHFNALKIFSTLSRIYVINWNSSGEDNGANNNNNTDSYHLMSKHSLDETMKHESLHWLTNNSSLMDYLCNSTAVKYDRFKDFKLSDNYVSVSAFLSKYVQEYQLSAMFRDLNYHKLLHCDYYYLNRNNTTNIFSSSIIGNKSLVDCFQLSNKIQQQQKFNEEKINRSLIDNDCEEMKEDLVKVSKYTTDILVPRMNGFLSKTVNPYISTVRIDLNSSISSGKHKIINSSENKYEENYTRDYLSYDFSCVNYRSINNNAWCSFESPVIISSSMLFSLRGQYHHRRNHFQHFNSRKNTKFSISNQTTISTNIIKFNKDYSPDHHHYHKQHHQQQQQQTEASYMETSYSSSSNSKFRHIVTFPHLPCISLLLFSLQRTQTISLRLFTDLFNWFRLFLRNILHLLFFLLPSLFGK